jgi:hypothetical protein
MTADVEVVRRLQTGWWENVTLVGRSGLLRVRKELHRLDAPWARDVFIKEWQYLCKLPEGLRPPFVRVIAQCDELLMNPPPPDRPLWFDMEYLDGYTDVRALLAEGRVSSKDAECIQGLLIDALLNCLYHLPGEPFEVDRIIWPVFEQVMDFAERDAELAPYARSPRWVINGRARPNLKQTVPVARADRRARQQFESSPSVRLHGDLFYENVLYRPDPPAIGLIDPVSVAGVAAGPVVFDRVKFDTWVSGELYALRHGRFEVRAGPGRSPPRVDYVWSADDPVLKELRKVDLASRVLAAMDERTGPSESAQAILAAYFNLAMVPNTAMPQRLLRYARATEIMARWAE